MSFKSDMTRMLGELGNVVDALDENALTEACEMICAARAIIAYGCGREGLQMQGLAMRLHHLGLHVAMQGDMAAPPLGAGDLFIASAGPGHLSTVEALTGQALAGGAKVLFLTAQADAAMAERVHHTLRIPAQTMANDTGADVSAPPMGSLYEAAMGLVFDAMVQRLRVMLNETADTMRARHTNME